MKEEVVMVMVIAVLVIIIIIMEEVPATLLATATLPLGLIVKGRGRGVNLEEMVEGEEDGEEVVEGRRRRRRRTNGVGMEKRGETEKTVEMGAYIILIVPRVVVRAIVPPPRRVAVLTAEIVISLPIIIIIAIVTVDSVLEVCGRVVQIADVGDDEVAAAVEMKASTPPRSIRDGMVEEGGRTNRNHHSGRMGLVPHFLWVEIIP